MRSFTIACVLLWSLVASAQQLLPLTDWRAQLDIDLGKIAMSRDAHGQVIGILQAYERAAQTDKQRHLPQQTEQFREQLQQQREQLQQQVPPPR